MTTTRASDELARIGEADELTVAPLRRAAKAQSRGHVGGGGVERDVR